MATLDENVARGNWSSKLDFILSCLGYTVGLGNVWRFPYLAYSYGGAIFLTPYAVAMLLVGIPMFFLELSLGQFTSSGALTCWRMAPIAQGIGAAMLVVSSVLAVYYNMIIAWALYYLIASFTALPNVPWQYCNRKWATVLCGDFIWRNISESPQNCSKAVAYDSPAGSYLPFNNGLCIGMHTYETNASWFMEANKSSHKAFIYEGGYRQWISDEMAMEVFNPSLIQHHTNPIAGSNFTKGLVGFWNDSLAASNGYTRKGPASEYFIRQVLGNHLSSGMSDLGYIHWDLAVPLLVAWLVVFVSLIKGIKSSGKVVYFTAVFPYIVLLTLMIRGLLMDGSSEGISYYLRGYGTHPADVPQDITTFYKEKLSNIEVWRKAAEQTFFSLSACYGGLITLSSYNRFNNNVFRDALIVTVGDAITSFFAGLVVFSYLGALAKNLGVRVSQVTDSGIGLAFVVYPEAVTHIRPAPMWAVLFFIMLLTLGLDSEFGLMETILTSVLDISPNLRPRKTLVIAALCLVFYLVGLTMCTSGGLYVLVLLDAFGSGWNVLLIAVLECVTVAWIYSIIPQLTGAVPGGSSRFIDDIQTMIGSNTICLIPWRYFKWLWIVMWSIVTPILCSMLMIGSLVDYGSKPPLQQGDYVYEMGFLVLGWFISVLVIAVLILGAMTALRRTGCRLSKACKPTRLWGPALAVHRKLCVHLEEIQKAGRDDEDDEDGESSYEAFKERRKHRSRSRTTTRVISEEEVNLEPEDNKSLTKDVIGFRPSTTDSKYNRKRSHHSRKSEVVSNDTASKKSRRSGKSRRRENT